VTFNFSMGVFPIQPRSDWYIATILNALIGAGMPGMI